MLPTHTASKTEPAPDITGDALLEIRNLKTYFPLDVGTVRAVDDVDITIPRGKTLAIIGESGSGKSVTAQSILRIVPPPGRIVSGEILFHQRQNGAITTVDLAKLDPSGKRMREIRGKEIGMIFQDPMTSFGPLHTIGQQISETILIHEPVSKREARDRTIHLLERVGIPRAAQRFDAYPHQFSGGMRQRAMIAMALSCNPGLLIADEPTTALDVSIQAQILELLKEVQEEFHMTLIVITHNLGVVAELAEEVIVMYFGKVVEQAAVRDLFDNPKHPYTKRLLECIPKIGKRDRLEAIRGSVPEPYRVLPGCPFYERCPETPGEVCIQALPPLYDVGSRHLVRCVLYDENLDETLKRRSA